MVSTSRVWSAGKRLVLLAALGATFLVSAFVAVRFAVRAREVTRARRWPGRSVNDASVQLDDLGLTLRVDDNQRADPKVPAGRILQQEPAPGARVRRARSIRVWVSAGEATTVVPDLVGQTERTAQMRLQQDGLTLAARRRDPIARLRRRGRGRAGAGADREGRPRGAAREPRRPGDDAT